MMKGKRKGWEREMEKKVKEGRGGGGEGIHHLLVPHRTII